MRPEHFDPSSYDKMDVQLVVDLTAARLKELVRSAIDDSKVVNDTSILPTSEQCGACLVYLDQLEELLDTVYAERVIDETTVEDFKRRVVTVREKYMAQRAALGAGAPTRGGKRKADDGGKVFGVAHDTSVHFIDFGLVEFVEVVVDLVREGVKVVPRDLVTDALERLHGKLRLARGSASANPTVEQAGSGMAIENAIVRAGFAVKASRQRQY
jgi:hypothetical protein